MNPFEEAIRNIEASLTANYEWHQRHRQDIIEIGKTSRDIRMKHGDDASDKSYQAGLELLRISDPNHGL